MTIIKDDYLYISNHRIPVFELKGRQNYLAYKSNGRIHQTTISKIVRGQKVKEETEKIFFELLKKHCKKTLEPINQNAKRD
ncbi:MAG: hypothetical protein A2V66_03500 [Ignavibacteria bacterium RBG_13_36_8]|nr:MAG: hypothetical protein A2V66_03500 [Ignavibacteria bacterium RBG_13_36_8]